MRSLSNSAVPGAIASHMHPVEPFRALCRVRARECPKRAVRAHSLQPLSWIDGRELVFKTAHHSQVIMLWGRCFNGIARHRFELAN